MSKHCSTPPKQSHICNHNHTHASLFGKHPSNSMGNVSHFQTYFTRSRKSQTKVKYTTRESGTAEGWGMTGHAGWSWGQIERRTKHIQTRKVPTNCLIWSARLAVAVSHTHTHKHTHRQSERVFHNMQNWRATCKRYSLLCFRVKIMEFLWSSSAFKNCRVLC